MLDLSEYSHPSDLRGSSYESSSLSGGGSSTTLYSRVWTIENRTDLRPTDSDIGEDDADSIVEDRDSVMLSLSDGRDVRSVRSLDEVDLTMPSSAELMAAAGAPPFKGTTVAFIVPFVIVVQLFSS